MIRQGECNRCGMCCGSPEAPNSASPFPVNWPDAVRTWNYSDLIAVHPILTTLGIIPKAGEDTVDWDESGSTRIVGPSGGTYYWIWIYGQGCCTDLPPYGDSTTFNVACPYLKDDDLTGGGIPHRPCGLVGTRFSSERDDYCGWQEAATEEMNAESVAQWQTDHPNCSFTWVEE